ncbi:molybdate ABC transporter substrate-binding protein [Stenotrophomonas sp. SORGH_AS_0282]|uniref:molybdate ABC transporter substrate-binding protein n=1 Tax=Stenotrophomonas sp. SORGH_AS_0282 TaxID=3041763 RepID=UPI00277F150B|nr:molybdate ABC transporter substrate-binding protein [Stenotrophomonas sp. SORGH_AS_0282]MDQ1062698.1 molybdate transport system substrate-binding protein [Stenotrophomonas sp. SORGH_AS_0282]MDQ1188948.1 molybdate transport system substrate-binding protein [Stenotrophomonas sp. SORGH_AS_0282]
MKRLLFLLLMVAALPATSAELTVSAASSLTESFRDITSAYEAAHPGTKVDLNFAASGVLLQQVSRGAPVDVLATADTETMAQAAKGGLLENDSRQIFATNRLVVVVPPGRRDGPASLAALAGKGVQRVAIGNPDSVPVGRYARAALQDAGLWEAITAKTITTQNVRQSLDYVARGEVDAGFVYASDYQATPGRVVRAFDVPLKTPIKYPVAVIKDSARAAEARRFVAFVVSPQGQAILRRHGFGAP